MICFLLIFYSFFFLLFHTIYSLLFVNLDMIFMEDRHEACLGIDTMSVEEAVEIIQRNERGRQGVERANAHRICR